VYPIRWTRRAARKPQERQEERIRTKRHIYERNKYPRRWTRRAASSPQEGQEEHIHTKRNGVNTQTNTRDVGHDERRVRPRRVEERPEAVARFRVCWRCEVVAHVCLVSRVQGLWCRVQGSAFKIQGSGCRVQGSGCRVQGSGFRVQG
jgi:hypothetical protein